MTTERQTRSSGKLPKWTPEQWEEIVRPEGAPPMTDAMIAAMVTASLPHGDSVTPTAVTIARGKAHVRPAYGAGQGWSVVNSVYWFPLKPYDYSLDLGVFYTRMKLEARGKVLPREEKELVARRKSELLAMADPQTGIEQRWVLCYDPGRKPSQRIYAHRWHPDDGEQQFVCQRHNPTRMESSA